MKVLADVVLGVGVDKVSEEEARQLGYLASLAGNITVDTAGNLKAFALKCRSLAGLPESSRDGARDHIQKSWGASWHMDAAKLRRELPLHVLKRRRANLHQSA